MKALLPALLALSLAACSTTSPDVIQRGDAQRLSQVQDATVLSVRPVVVEGSQSGTGAVAGGVVGGLAGSARGGSSRESAAIGVVGAVAGAVIGNTVERFGTRENAFEILIQLKNGERRSIVQAQGQETFTPGEAVILVTTGGRTRVTKAPGAAGTPASPSAATPGG